MADGSSIEWTNATWNPLAGCSIVSPGCTNCYAMKMAHRVGPNFPHYAGLTTLTKGGPVWTGKVTVAPDHIFLQPLHWKKPRQIFVNSMSDLFHEDVPDAVIDRVFAVMALCPQHTFQVLTKRADRMREWSLRNSTGGHILHVASTIGRPQSGVWPLPGVWLGVSAEDQRRADERIPLLLETPAAVRWVSAEPLLGALDLRAYLIGHEEHGVDMAREVGARVGACIGWRPPLDWIVAGGESGPNARPSHPDWFRSLRDQCAAADVPYFFKQHGAWADYRQLGATEWTFIEERAGKRYGFIADDKFGMFGGRLFETAYPWARETEVGPGPCMVRVGKGNAGALLDGREHREFPR
jgi:protein gp37